ncbi:hypothetical protein ALP05_200189 [Pseudomonas caricapapayae]|uniref:Uncharacterized protein n=1 Tax=Pseudomonas caricapapayae TaxID=46678 RepID=A0A3M6F1X0_9PSED|nr:hypothetical protein ALP05_200189 [Pseudomonas caricapapayae]
MADASRGPPIGGTKEGCATLWIAVTTCNRNGLDLQSSRFWTGIDCVYPSRQTGIICE